MLQTLRILSALTMSAVLVACGGGVDVAPVEGYDGPTTGTVEITLADPAKGTLTSLTLDLSRIAGPLSGLTDDQGASPKEVKAIDLGQVCYMSNRAGWNDQASACTNIHPGNRPKEFVCYDDYSQPTTCPDAFLGDSGQVNIFRNLRNNDRGLLRVQVAATSQWYTLDQKKWPCIGTTACVETSDFLMEYGGYRAVTGTFSCENGVPTARIHFGTDAVSGFGPALKPGDIAGNANWNSDAVGWADSSGASGSIERDTRGDYVFVVSGLPVKEPAGNFTIRNNKNGEWSWMDPTTFVWSTNVTVNLTTYMVSYDLGACP